mmetsp:Transcript_9731/g.19138  ORF Transcript_9731/g.19138 Transcript_9731/m.19138 type:complete len:186 (-) Transcript_9731:543-1100(-)
MGNCICYLRKDEEGYPVPMSTMPIEGFEEFVCEGHLIAVKIPAIKNTGEERPGSRKMYVKLVSASKTMSCYESRTQTAPVYIIPLEAIHKVSKSGTKGLEVGLVGDWTFVFEAESLGEQMRWLLNLQEMLKKNRIYQCSAAIQGFPLLACRQCHRTADGVAISGGAEKRKETREILRILRRIPHS